MSSHLTNPWRALAAMFQHGGEIGKESDDESFSPGGEVEEESEMASSPLFLEEHTEEEGNAGKCHGPNEENEHKVSQVNPRPLPRAIKHPKPPRAQVS